jgi:hypothetical protein
MYKLEIKKKQLEEKSFHSIEVRKQMGEILNKKVEYINKKRRDKEQNLYRTLNEREMESLIRKQ